MSLQFDLLLIADLATAEASGIDLVGAVARALGAAPGGRLAVQLRAKQAPAARIFDLAEALRRATSDAGAPFLINDRLDVALAVGADGVHLGHGSVTVADARRLMPTGLVGVSTHSAAEVAQKAAGADYAVFGPVFATPGKGPPVGLPVLREATDATDVPVFALGGVGAANAAACIEHGARGLAFIRSVLAAADPAAAVRSIATACEKLVQRAGKS